MFITSDYDKNESMTQNIQRAFSTISEDAMPGRLQDLLDQLREVEFVDEAGESQKSD